MARRDATSCFAPASLPAGWDALRRCQLASCTYRCAGSSYEQYLAQLPALHRKDLLLPRGTRLLAYGSSYLGQVMEALVCGGGRIVAQRSFEFPPVEAAARPSSKARSSCCDGGGVMASGRRAGRLLRYEFENDASLVLVINYAPLQQSDQARIHLPKFLRGGAFTHAVFLRRAGVET